MVNAQLRLIGVAFVLGAVGQIIASYLIFPFLSSFPAWFVWGVAIALVTWIFAKLGLIEG